ncbi:MAG TPA: helix-turn-helix domain-containing protein [Dokdonella sp.]|nr:helix-turn-helix domain-containing protein [Dokdonella sp.]
MDGDGAPRIRSLVEDSALGRWRMDLCRPSPLLAPYVAHLWYVEGHIHYQRDRILPGGGSFLLINLGPAQFRIEPGPPERRIAFNDAWFTGLQQSPIDTEVPGGSALLGVAFHNHGARPWLHVDAHHCADSIVPLTDLLGDSVLALRQQLLECPTSARRFALVEAWIVARLEPRFAPSPLVRRVLSEIEVSRGAIAIDALAVRAGVSRKLLGQRFRCEVGLTTKSLARVHRFRHALEWLRHQDRVPWAELAARCGYYDQSHLIRDFHAFSGMTPGELLRRQQPDPGSVVLDG